MARVTDARVRPHLGDGAVTDVTDDARWGELRSMCARPLSGGESWLEWAELLDGFLPEVAPEAIAYVASSWDTTAGDLAALRDRFRERVMRANLAAMRDAGVSPMAPPSTREVLDAWESYLGVTFPSNFTRFVLDVSAGDATDFGEYGVFDMSTFAPEPDREPVTFGIMMAILEKNAEDAAEIVDALAQKRQRLHDLVGDVQGNALFFVRWYMEGNHGDASYFLVCDGPQTGHVVMVRDFFISPDAQRMSVELKSWEAFLWQTYLDVCLGEDVWAESAWTRP